MSIDDRNIVLDPGEGKVAPVPGHKITQKVVGAATAGALRAARRTSTQESAIIRGCR